MTSPPLTMSRIPQPWACANFDCPNRPGEGLFVIVESETKIVGGHRKLRMWMCSPCAAAITGCDLGGQSPSITVPDSALHLPERPALPACV